ncbi:MAG: DUF1002 domain-containing protein [Bacteriovoracaceae bacterium]|nr:DUF1002 domain-containing protein [Bacteriovoracaceae bacterium]
MNENKIRAWGYFLNRVLLGIAAIVGACKAPQAISDYAINVKTEQIINNAMSTVVKIASSIKNENHNTIVNQYKEKLQSSLNNPSEFKKEIAGIPEPVLQQLGLKTSKADLSHGLEDKKTTEDVRKFLNEKLPNLLLDAAGKPFLLDRSKPGQ